MGPPIEDLVEGDYMPDCMLPLTVLSSFLSGGSGQYENLSEKPQYCYAGVEGKGNGGHSRGG